MQQANRLERAAHLARGERFMLQQARPRRPWPGGQGPGAPPSGVGRDLRARPDRARAASTTVTCTFSRSTPGRLPRLRWQADNWAAACATSPAWTARRCWPPSWARPNRAGWVEYDIVNPASGAVQAKMSYVVKVDACTWAAASQDGRSALRRPSGLGADVASAGADP